MQTLSVDQWVGQTFGHHQIVRLLTKGRLKTLYLAFNQYEQRMEDFTVYHIPERFSPEAQQRFLERFSEKTAVISKLKHQHILPVLEYGIYEGFPYLVTPQTSSSLLDVIKQGRHSYFNVLHILKQIAAGVEYAHARGLIHQALRPSNIVISNEQTVLIAGFGLIQMLQIRDVEQCDHPYKHLLNIFGTFLTAPEYIAPEIVQDAPIDARTDIYAMGAVLFELLSGVPPFKGSNTVAIAKQHVDQPAPSLRTLAPAIPGPLAKVVDRALERDPAYRFQQVDELVEAFALAIQCEKSVAVPRQDIEKENSPAASILPDVATTVSIAEQVVSTNMGSTLRNDAEAMLDKENVQEMSLKQRNRQPASGNLTRRHLVSVFGVGGVLAASGVVLFEIFHPLRPMDDDGNRSPYKLTSQTTSKVIITGKSTTPLVERAGPVVGMTSMPVNSSANFTNPVSGQPGILIHLPDGAFAAYSRSCPPNGALVDYDPKTYMLFCPANGALFDPSRDGAAMRGVQAPLTEVPIRINVDGTIVIVYVAK